VLQFPTDAKFPTAKARDASRFPASVEFLIRV